MKGAYPSTGDLQSFVSSQGLSTGSLDYVTAADLGATLFEERVGGRMLAGAATLRRFDPPQGPENTVRTGWLAATPTLVQYVPLNGTAETFVSGTDYWLLPANAADEATGGNDAVTRRPWSHLRIARYRRWAHPLRDEQRHSLQVTGQWGYHATGIPEDAWTAMLLLGLGVLFPAVGVLLAGGRRVTVDSGIRREYGDALLPQAMSWLAFVSAVTARYRRLGV